MHAAATSRERDQGESPHREPPLRRRKADAHGKCVAAMHRELDDIAVVPAALRRLRADVGALSEAMERLTTELAQHRAAQQWRDLSVQKRALAAELQREERKGRTSLSSLRRAAVSGQAHASVGQGRGAAPSGLDGAGASADEAATAATSAGVEEEAHVRHGPSDIAVANSGGAEEEAASGGAGGEEEASP